MGNRASGLVEIELRRSPRFFRAAIYGAAVVLVVGGVAAYFVRVPEVVRAQGVVRPAREMVSVDAERAGRVLAVHVKEGDVVAAGAALLEFDAGSLPAETALLEKRLERLRVQRHEIGAILAALERGGEPKSLDRYAGRYAAVRAELAMQAARVRSARRQLARVDGLDRGVVSDSDLSERRDAFRTAELTLRQMREGHRGRLEAERQQARTEELDLRSRLAAMRRDLERCRVTAPVAGKVTFAAIRERGGFVQAGERLFRIAPPGAGWVMEAWLPEDRPGKVEVGMGARIQLAPYPTNDYGTLHGRVEEISPDAQRRESGPPARRVLVRLSSGEVRGPSGRGRVGLGMSGEARIVTRERRLLFHLTGDWSRVLRLDE